jgi:predicted RecA/RadA family phage recombinase
MVSVYVSEGMTQAFVVSAAAIKIGDAVLLNNDGTISKSDGSATFIGVAEGASFRGKYSGIPGTPRVQGQIEIGEQATVRMKGLVKCLCYAGSATTAGNLLIGDTGNPGGVVDAAGTEWAGKLIGTALDSVTGSSAGVEVRVLLLR